MKLTRLNRLKFISLSALLLSLILPQIATADALSLSAGGGIWNESASGNFKESTDPAPIDVKDNLFWDTESQGYLFVTLEHFVPIIPNARLMYTKIDHTGSGNGNFIYNGTPYNNAFTNTINLETLDLLLYYEVLDNIISLDIGLNIRNLQADFTITDKTTNVTDNDSIDETIPMVYALVGFSPLTDLIISGEMSYITYDGSTVYDFTAKIAYTTNFFVGVEAGFRSQKFELNDIEGTDTDLTFDGPFAGVYLKF